MLQVLTRRRCHRRLLLPGATVARRAEPLGERARRGAVASVCETAVASPRCLTPLPLDVSAQKPSERCGKNEPEGFKVGVDGRASPAARHPEGHALRDHGWPSAWEDPLSTKTAGSPQTAPRQLREPSGRVWAGSGTYPPRLLVRLKGTELGWIGPWPSDITEGRANRQFSSLSLIISRGDWM